MQVNRKQRVIFWEAERDPLRLVHVSPHVEEVFGYTPKQWFDKRFWAEHIHPNDRESVIEFGLKAIERGENHDFSYRFQRADGTYVWVRDIVEVRGDRLHGALMDISTEKRYERNLEKSESRFRKFFQEDQAIKLLIHADTGAIIDANTAALHFYGYSLQEITALNIDQINTLSKRAVERERLKAKDERRKFFNFEHRLKSGELRKVEVYSTPIELEGNVFLHSVVHDVTEIDKARKALSQSERRYRTITEMAPVGVAIHVEGKVKYVNPEALRIIEAAFEEQIIDTPINRYVTIQKQEEVEQLNTEILDGSRPFVRQRDETLITLKGNKRYCLLTGIPIDYQGQPAVYIVFTDITERKIAENQRRESERLYRLLADNITDLITLHDLRLNYLYVSPSHHSLGYEPEDLLGTSVLDIIHQDDHKLILEALEQNYESDTVTYRVRKKDGTYIWVESSSRILKNPETGTLQLLSVTRDVNDRIKMEKALEHSRAVLGATFDKSTDAIFLVGEDGNVVECNTRVVELFEGEHTGDFIGRKGEYFELRSQFPLRDVRQQLDKGQPVLNRQVQYVTLKKNTFWGNFAARRFQIQGARYTIIVVTDISRLKAMEQKMESLYETEQTLNAQLLERNEELVRINSELDHFVYRVSHDLRAPLASSFGLINLSEHSESLEELKSYIALQKKSLLKLDHFIEDIMDYSRNARLDTEPEEIPLPGFIQDIFEQLRFAPKSERVRKEVILSPESVGFKSDIRRVKMIFSNLLANAIQYSDMYKETPFVRVRIKISGEEAVFEVEDNGYGIRAELQHKVFDMFARATTREHGSGLGLYIVKEAVRKLQGEIKLDSTFGQGSTFKVVLPNLSN